MRSLGIDANSSLLNREIENRTEVHGHEMECTSYFGIEPVSTPMLSLNSSKRISFSVLNVPATCRFSKVNYAMLRDYLQGLVANMECCLPGVEYEQELSIICEYLTITLRKFLGITYKKFKVCVFAVFPEDFGNANFGDDRFLIGHDSYMRTTSRDYIRAEKGYAVLLESGFIENITEYFRASGLRRVNCFKYISKGIQQ